MNTYYNVYMFWLLSNLKTSLFMVCFTVAILTMGFGLIMSFTKIGIECINANPKLVMQLIVIGGVFVILLGLIHYAIPGPENLARIISTANSIDIIGSYPEPLITMLEEQK